ncbi:exported hypothetical protein [Mesorhizobium delmotii]|uniref:Rap1a immunity protein domain-containing protein n=1 Tax=Mesorhizobium delmotii TaxID=1631247 RepID=A0A2P9AU20_9HYPH|nr:exported hypothetical protein [Mesorhizobium delmotii]
MRKRAIVIAATICWSPAQAITGSQLLDYNEEYGRGFTWGVATALTSIAGKDEMRVAQFRRACFVNGKISEETFYAAVNTWIKNHPSELARDASGPIISVINEICGLPAGAPRKPDSALAARPPRSSAPSQASRHGMWRERYCATTEQPAAHRAMRRRA